jgi:hypothetical protein
MVNRESLPLILALLVPIGIILLFILYYYGFNVFSILKKIPILYYIIIIPMILGFTVIIIKWMRPS